VRTGSLIEVLAMTLRSPPVLRSAHPSFSVFSLGFVVVVVLSGFVELREPSPFWSAVARANVLAALAWGMLTAVLGFADYLAIPSNTRLSRVGLARSLTNVAVLFALVVTLALGERRHADSLRAWSLASSSVALILALASAWLGSTLRPTAAPVDRPET
jgi:uncharacterized membrane protein